MSSTPAQLIVTHPYSSPSAFESLFGPEFGHGKPIGLAPLRTALAAFDAPHLHLPPTIHVAGANGKGSTIAFMRAIAEAAGLKVHAYTKPHLVSETERFTLASETIASEQLAAAARRVHDHAPGLTYFDAQLAAAFLLFAETPADLVLLETGMGGRDDSTNVIERPALSVLTPIGVDHADALGETLTQIAAHKAGIIKPGAPVISARQRDDAREIIEARARALGAPLLQQGADWDAYASAGRLVVQTETRALDLPMPALRGAHQFDNAGLASAALMHLFEFPDAAFAEGVANVNWPARLQPLTRGRLSAPIRALGGEVWVDGGHNADAAAALSRALSAMNARAKRYTLAIVGMRARKDADAFFAAIAPGLDAIIAVPLNTTGHIAPLDLADIARRFIANAAPAPSLAAAMEAAIENAAQSPAPRVLICGSFVLAAEALALEA
jgi:dihydrofolate synthase/folylpolyglutamate synthase